MAAELDVGGVVMERPGTSSALDELDAWYKREREEAGLLEMTFCPGSDREVGKEEAAAVALAMLKYQPVS